MEEKILEKLLYERYSVKQMVGYFIIGFKETENKDKFEEIMNNVTTVIVNIDKNKLVDLVDVEFIEKIDLYWCSGRWRRTIPPVRTPGRPCGSTPRGWHTTGPQGR